MSCSCSLSQTGNRWHDLPRGIVHFKGNAYEQHHGVKFSHPVSVIHQTSWKFCVFLYLGFTVTLPNRLLNATVVHFLHLLVGKMSLHQRSGYILKCLEIWNSVNWMLLPVFHHITPTTSVAETTYEMHVSIFFSEF